jgi:hypothetical protein
MSLFDRFRYAVAGLRRRPGTALVHVGRSEPLPRPRPRRALPPLEHPVCPRCGLRHEPRPLPGWGSSGLSAYARPIAPDPWALGRPAPLGRGPADLSSLARDSAGAWAWGNRRPLLPTPPPPSGQREELHAELDANRAPSPGPDPPAEPAAPNRPGRGLRMIDVIGQRPPWA